MVCSHMFFEIMSKKEMSIHIIKLSGKLDDLESWSKILLSHEKCKGCNKKLVSIEAMVGVDEIHTHDKYDNSLV